VQEQEGDALTGNAVDGRPISDSGALPRQMVGRAGDPIASHRER